MPALGDLFAPAYLKSDPTSVQTLQTWTDKNRPMTNAMVEQSRAPVAGVNTGNPAGMVDPEALRTLSQGGAYDINARRDSVAAAAQAQQKAAAAQPQNPMAAYWAAYGQRMGVNPYANAGWQTGNQLPGLMGGDGSGFMGGGNYGNPYNDPFQIPPGGA